MGLRAGILRYFGYALLAAGLGALLHWLALSAAGSLRIRVLADGGASLGTSEYSLVEWLQSGLILVCGLTFAWIAVRDRLRRPLGVAIAALFGLFLIRELDYFLDRLLADNLWQVLAALLAVAAGVYLWRERGRLVIAWQRSWPSAGLAILFAGLVVLVPFAQITASDPLWRALLAEDYSRSAKLAYEELTELGAYLLIGIGSLEFLYAWSRLPKTRSIDPPRRAGRSR